MLTSLAECKLLANFLIIEESRFKLSVSGVVKNLSGLDREDVGGQDLYVAFLKKYGHDDLIKQINVICCENPPEFYFPINNPKIEKIVCHDFFSDPCGWNSPLTLKQHLSLLTSDTKSLSETAVFIDSLSLLAYHEGFFSTCRILNVLKRYSKYVLCLVHGDLFSSEQLEELLFFATAYIKLHDFPNEKNFKEKLCEITYKKPGGKVIKQKEYFFVSNDFKISSRIPEKRALVKSDKKKEIESLSTFKLGLHISEEEKRARDELVLPYLKTEVQNKTGEIIYQTDADEFEDDPDDDLDI